MRDKDDLPYAKTVLVIGEGAIQPIELLRSETQMAANVALKEKSCPFVVILTTVPYVEIA